MYNRRIVRIFRAKNLNKRFENENNRRDKYLCILPRAYLDISCYEVFRTYAWVNKYIVKTLVRIYSFLCIRVQVDSSSLSTDGLSIFTSPPSDNDKRNLNFLSVVKQC